jgi:opacity protein-like surface antigen
VKRFLLALAALAVALGLAPPVGAFDADQTFARNTFVLSGETAYGHQFNPENFSQTSDVQFVNVGVRFGWLPFDPVGPGPLRGSLEAGVEPIYQQYFEPKVEYFAGVAAVLRYHFLSLGRFVPYLELAGAPGGTNLKVPEIDSSFSFLLWAGAGASYFVSDRTAIYAGYRWSHLSNGGTSSPNRGIEAHTAVVGVSWFFK